MSIYTGRVGTPPQKSRWHINGTMLLTVFIVLVVLAVALWLMYAYTQPQPQTTAVPYLGANPYGIPPHAPRIDEWQKEAPAPMNPSLPNLDAVAKARGLGVR